MIRALTVAALLGAATTAQAATDWLMQVPNVNGGALLQNYQNWFDLQTLSVSHFAVAEFDGQGGRTIGAPVFNEITVTLTPSQGADQLLFKSFAGQSLDTVVIAGVLTSIRGGEVQRLTLTDARITGMKQTASSGDVPSLEMTLSFTQYCQVVNYVDSQGTIRPGQNMCYDVANGAPL